MLIYWFTIRRIRFSYHGEMTLIMGKRWQIPGGVIRMLETIDERIQRTAIREIGRRVDYNPEPIAVHDNIIYQRREGLQNQFERAHNVALTLCQPLYVSCCTVLLCFSRYCTVRLKCFLHFFLMYNLWAKYYKPIIL